MGGEAEVDWHDGYGDSVGCLLPSLFLLQFEVSKGQEIKNARSIILSLKFRRVRQ